VEIKWVKESEEKNVPKAICQKCDRTIMAKEGVFKSFFLSFAPFAQAALLKERVVRCFSNHQQLACWDSIVVAFRIAPRESGES
jgi:hypothetical protein